MSAVPSQASPMQNITDNFRKQNEVLASLIDRLRNKLHGLSDTNFPKEENPNKEVQPALPFNEGHLKDYYESVIFNQRLLDALSNEVNKIEVLI